MGTTTYRTIAGVKLTRDGELREYEVTTTDGATCYLKPLTYTGRRDGATHSWKAKWPSHPDREVRAHTLTALVARLVKDGRVTPGAVAPLPPASDPAGIGRRIDAALASRKLTLDEPGLGARRCDNPAGWCIYDDDTDGAHERCVFCGKKESDDE